MYVGMDHQNILTLYIKNVSIMNLIAVTIKGVQHFFIKSSIRCLP